MVASISDFLVHKKYTLTLLWGENFFSLIRSNGKSKNSSFHTDFKNVHMTLVKSASKKSFAQKTIFLGTFSIGKTVFWLKLFWVHFLLRSYVHFWNQYEKTNFLIAPFDLFKEKKFSSLRRDNESFWRTEMVKNGRNRSILRKTVFYKQILDFYCPSKILCHTSKLWNFVKITGPYYTPMYRQGAYDEKKMSYRNLVLINFGSRYRCEGGTSQEAYLHYTWTVPRGRAW